MARHLGAVWLVAASCYMNGPPPPRQTPFPPQQQPPPPAEGPTPQRAATDNLLRVQLDLDNEASLTAVGFTNNRSGTSRFANGRLEIDTNSYEEWSQLADVDDGFVERAGNGPWAVEARFAETTPCPRGGTGMWIHDGMYFVHLVVTDHEIVLDHSHRTYIGPTSQLRTYRVEMANKTVTVLVDGKPVTRMPAQETGATMTLMFGAMGDGCPRNTSTWEYIAYETTPGPGAMWPHRSIWHAGTQAQPLIDAIHSALPAIKVPAINDRDVPCLAIFALDGAVRDLLPLAYFAQHSVFASNAFRDLSPMVDTHALGDAQRTLRTWTEPRGNYPCDPVAGHRCPPPRPPMPPAPIPAIEPGLRAAVESAIKWSLHPDNAEKSTALAAKAYAEAVAAGTPGAAGAVKRFQRRLDSLATHPKHCGL
jgi:hypothetical protein